MQSDDEAEHGTRWSIASFVAGTLAGAACVLAGLWKGAPSLMMHEQASPYDFETTAHRFETAVDETTGWKILGEYDLQAKMETHGYQVDRAAVYEICAPEYASNILSGDDERIVTPMMPCRVSVYEKSDGTTYVGRMNADLFSRVFGGTIRRTMSKAYRDSEGIIESTLDPSRGSRSTDEADLQDTDDGDANSTTDIDQIQGDSGPDS